MRDTMSLIMSRLSFKVVSAARVVTKIMARVAVGVAPVPVVAFKKLVRYMRLPGAGMFSSPPRSGSRVGGTPCQSTRQQWLPRRYLARVRVRVSGLVLEAAAPAARCYPRDDSDGSSVV